MVYGRDPGVSAALDPALRQSSRDAPTHALLLYGLSGEWHRWGRGVVGRHPSEGSPGHESTGNTIGQEPCILRHMTHVTRVLSAIENGDPQAAKQLLPLVYDELRKLA